MRPYTTFDNNSHFASQAFTLAYLWSLSTIKCMSRSAGTFRSIVSKEGQEFLMPVTLLTAAQDGAGRHVQRGKQGGGPVSDRVMCHPLDIARSQG